MNRMVSKMEKNILMQFNRKRENDGIFIYWNKDGIKTRVVCIKMDKKIFI